MTPDPRPPSRCGWRSSRTPAEAPQERRETILALAEGKGGGLHHPLRADGHDGRRDLGHEVGIAGRGGNRGHALGLVNGLEAARVHRGSDEARREQAGGQERGRAGRAAP